MKPGLHFADVIEIHELAAADAGELIGIELSDESFQGFPHKIRFAAGMQAEVIAVGLRPLELLDRQEELFPAGLHEEPPHVAWRRGRLARRDPAARALQHALE